MAGIIEVSNRLPQLKPSRDEINMTMAEVVALRGTCQRKQVGCVIVKNSRVISTGYNGSAYSGSCVDLKCDITNKCTHSIHAEANAIMAAARQGISLIGTTLYCTTQPCYECAKLIIQSGIERVIWQEPYTNDEGQRLINKTGRIICKSLKDAE